MRYQRYQGRQRGGGGAVFMVYLVLALYFVNVPFQFVKTPDTILSVEKWIIFLGGLFLVLGGINFLKSKRYGL